MVPMRQVVETKILATRVRMESLPMSVSGSVDRQLSRSSVRNTRLSPSYPSNCRMNCVTLRLS